MPAAEPRLRQNHIAVKRVAKKEPTQKMPTRIRDTREALNMRIRPEIRNLIDQAAELTGKNRTDFVLDAARQAAQNALLDQTVLPMAGKSYAAFLKLLDAQPQPNARLRKSLQTPAAWD